MENLKRKCPKCDNVITYKTLNGFKNAIKNNSLCKKCVSSGENNGMFGKKGNKNPFFGKKHSDETKSKQSKIKLGKRHTLDSINKLKTKFSGKNNPMFGKTFYEIWVEKLGVDIANEKLIEFKKKQSKNNSGENNNMFGKPPTHGSGNGWSGWYKDWYFRSLRELTYMIKIIERFNLKWETAESNLYKIEYTAYNGNKRNYFADFIINGKYLIESKPKKLWDTDSIKRKKESAVEFCNKNNLIYKLVDIGILTSDEIKSLYDSKLIKFIDRYEIKYQKLFNN